MKKLLIPLFSLFFLYSPSVFADDISDFSIEGISIGDSLLDYMTEEEILEEIELYDDYSFLNKSNKYIQIVISKKFQTYEYLAVFIKNNTINQYITNKNEKYTILSTRGAISYEEDFDGCLQKKDEVVAVLSEIFPNANKIESSYKHVEDPSGNSVIDQVSFELESGVVSEVSCYDFDETFRNKKNWTEGLQVSIDLEEISIWLGDY